MAMSTRTGPSTELRTGQEDVGCQQTAHAVIATSSASAAVHLSDQPSAAAQSARTGYPASTAAAALGTAPFQHSPQTSLSASPSRGNVSNPRSSTNRGHSNWGQADDVALQRCVRGYGVQNWSRAMAAFRKVYKGPALSDRLLLGRYNKLQADAQRRRKQAHASRLLRSSASWVCFASAVGQDADLYFLQPYQVSEGLAAISPGPGSYGTSTLAHTARFARQPFEPLKRAICSRWRVRARA